MRSNESTRMNKLISMGKIALWFFLCVALSNCAVPRSDLPDGTDGDASDAADGTLPGDATTDMTPDLTSGADATLASDASRETGADSSHGDEDARSDAGSDADSGNHDVRADAPIDQARPDVLSDASSDGIVDGRDGFSVLDGPGSTLYAPGPFLNVTCGARVCGPVPNDLRTRCRTLYGPAGLRKDRLELRSGS
jgi:hypothetical protein